MKFFPKLSAAALLLAASLAVRASVNRPVATPPADELTPAEIAQGFRDGVVLAKPHATHRATADAAEPGEGFMLHQKFSRFGDLRVLRAPSGMSVAAAIKRLRATGRYEFVEPDYLRFARVVPNDPSFSLQWSLQNFGQTHGINNDDIRAIFGWDVQHDAPNTLVAIIDSGIRLTHTDLVANLWTNPSTTAGDVHGARFTGLRGTLTSGNPTDDDGHGTHVAGIIGAVGNNGIGIAGVAWSVQLMPLKFLTATGGGALSDELACINYAMAHGAHIINASFGTSVYAQSEFNAISALRDAGIIFVAAAGNGNSSGIGFNTDNAGDYPAGYSLDNIVSVAASTATDTLTTFSNFGSGSVDLAAPGENIYSTYNSSDNGYQVLSGTSMAAPHVVGVLALLKAKFPADNYRQLINRLLRGVTPVSALSGKVQSGGRLNLQGALSTTDNRPMNDDFATRAVLAGPNVRVRSSNVGANINETGEPTHAGVATSASLWWEWTAPVSALVTFDTAGSGYDTALAVYTGTSLAGLAAVGSNDNDTAAGVTTSRLTLNVTAGTTYEIAVAGKNGATGQTVLKIGTVPANDNFANAQVVTGQSFVLNATNLNATAQTGEPKPISLAQGHTVWFKWVAPTTGRYQLSAFATLIDTTAAVFTGSSLTTLTTVASNDDASSLDSDALVPFNATAGQTYYFAVDNAGDGEEGADFVLSLTDAAWEYATIGEMVSSPAVASDGTIYVGSGSVEDPGFERRVHAVNPDGTVKWTHTTGNSFDEASPAVGADGTVYVGSADAKFYALNPATGAAKGSFNAGTAISSSPAIATDGTIYIHDDTTLYALLDTGAAFATKWRFPYNGANYASPAIAIDGTVYFGATGGTFYALKPDGTIRWSFTADDDIYTTPAIATDGTVYFGTLSGTFYALKPDGTQKWKWSAPGPTSISSSPAIGVDGTIYFAAYDHKLHALRADGTEKWAFTAADEIRASSPAIAADGTIYFGDYDFQIYAVNPDGTQKRVYSTGQHVRSSPLIANNRLYVGSNDGKLYAFDLGQGAAGSAWPMFRQGPSRVSRAVTLVAPTITLAPKSQSVGLGGGLVLSVIASGTGPFNYQWSKDGTPISGATAATYSVASVTAATAGNYTVAVIGGGGTTVSAPAAITTTTLAPARLTNLSVETNAGPGGQTLTVGFVLTGTPSKTLLIRGIGPALSAFNVGGTLPDPTLTVLGPNSSTLVAAANDNWNSADANAMAAAGAFPLTPNSKDAALVTTLTAGNYTAQVTGVTAGVALAEIYDTAIGTGAKLINLSTSAQVASGGVLIAGFTISGNAAKTVLIRGLGPAVTIAFGAGGMLPDPKLELYDAANNLINANDDWGATPELINAFTQTGAFKFGTAQTKDAALLVTLMPGGYTAQVRGVNNTSGLALIEVYEVP